MMPTHLPSSTGATSSIIIELQNRALLGPFDHQPFIAWLSISPIITRSKSDFTRRIIVDLSFPQGNNVNAYINKNIILGNFLEQPLPTVCDKLVVVEGMDYQVKLAKIDVERAYRNIPVCPLILPLLRINLGSEIFVDVAMPFGARNSSLYMQLIAQFLVCALQACGLYCQMYLDDMVVQFSPHHDYYARLIMPYLSQL